MKRCPQCEFIYEDDQSLCEMDGRNLVYDTSAVLIEEIAAMELTGRPAKSKSQTLAIVLVVVVVLGTVLFVGYNALPGLLKSNPKTVNLKPGNAHRTAPQINPDSSNKIATSPTSVPTLSQIKPAPALASRSESSGSKLKSDTDLKTLDKLTITKPSSTPPRSPSTKPKEKKPGRENTAAKNQPTFGKPENTTAKKESRIGSLLKKTGRVLKKPFQF